MANVYHNVTNAAMFRTYPGQDSRNLCYVLYLYTIFIIVDLLIILTIYFLYNFVSNFGFTNNGLTFLLITVSGAWKALRCRA